MKMYGFLAVIVGLLTPINWTLKTFFARRAFERKDFVPLDLAIDLLIFRNIFSVAIYVVFLMNNPFEWNVFIQGQIAGFFMLCGTISTMLALSKGPGGPI